MDKETLEQFLNSAGICGVALLNRQGRSYLLRSFAALDRRQQEALQEGLFQVLESMPPGFDFFDFQFAQQRIFVYPLSDVSVLIVGVDDQKLVLEDYTKAVDHLRATLLQDPNQGAVIFRGFTHQREPAPSPKKIPAPPPPPTGIPVTVVLRCLNHLSEVTHSYLGKAVVVNYWKTSRQEISEKAGEIQDFLRFFEVERSGEIRYTGSLASFNLEQIKMVRAWVDTFVRRCEEVIRNFRSLLRTQSNLSPEEQKLLLYGS
jgi:hypothetical protein